MSDIESRKIKIKNMIIELLENEKLNDREQEGLLFKIKKLSPDPEISDYIFWDKGEYWKLKNTYKVNPLYTIFRRPFKKQKCLYEPLQKPSFYVFHPPKPAETLK